MTYALRVSSLEQSQKRNISDPFSDPFWLALGLEREREGGTSFSHKSTFDGCLAEVKLLRNAHVSFLRSAEARRPLAGSGFYVDSRQPAKSGFDPQRGSVIEN